MLKAKMKRKEKNYEAVQMTIKLKRLEKYKDLKMLIIDTETIY